MTLSVRLKYRISACAGNFSLARDITLNEGLRRLTMQDALPALVLNSEALPRPVMNGTPSNPSNPAASATPPASTSTGVSDERLMLAFSKGSSDAFTELFSRYKQPIYGFFRRRVAESGHAEELAQETFFALLRAASRYEPRALFRTYLYAIGLKILRAHRRKAAFRATFFGQPKSAPDPSKRDATEAGLWVRRAVEKLDAIDREILLLREFEQLSYTEIADLLQLPLNTVRSRLFRARTALRNLLEPPVEPSTKDAPQPIAQKGERA
jgi:RNA polymerase sigma-70 factor, ECF subfamily